MRARDEDFFPERRRHPRIRIERHDLSFQCDLCGSGRDVAAETIELSRSGLLFLSPSDLPAGTSLRLRIRIPFHQTHVRASGRVLRSIPSGGGRYRVTAEYSKILSGSDEALYDTILDLLAP